MTASSLPIYIINLPDNPDRFDEIRRQANAFDCNEVIRVLAIRGALIADAACRLLTRNQWSVNHKGTLGCFLSHLRTWELIAAGTSSCGLVLEDDVKLQNLDKLLAAELPADCDLLWCNGRTAFSESSGAHFRSIYPALDFIEGHGRAVGGDCYLLTKSGSQKLLSFVETDSLFSHVDLRLLAYSLSPEEGRASRGKGRVSDNVGALRATYLPAHILCSYSFWPPLSQHLDSPSRRAAEDQLSERPAS